MIGEYVNKGRGKTVIISPVVPSAQYRITAWALLTSGGRRSATPGVEYANIGEARECGRHFYIDTMILVAEKESCSTIINSIIQNNYILLHNC